jgi:hypothetical protein
MQVNSISGYLPGRIVFFLVCHRLWWDRCFLLCLVETVPSFVSHVTFCCLVLPWVFSFHFASCSIKQFCEYGGSLVRLTTKDNHPAQRWKICGYTDCEESRLTACCCRLSFGSLKTDNFSLGLQVNTHITPRPILLTRHGESQDNIRGRIGGDPPLRYFSFFEFCIT